MEIDQENTQEEYKEEVFKPSRLKKFFTKKRIIILSIIAVIIIGIVFLATRKVAPVYELVEAKRKDISQEVSVTGRVRAAESVELAFESGGRVATIYVKIGDKVLPGAVLASLSNGDLTSQLLEAQANLQVEEANLSEAKRGTRPEELTKAQTIVDNANNNLDAVEAKANADLLSDYDGALTALQGAVVEGKNILITVSDIQGEHFSGNGQDELNLASVKAKAVEFLLGSRNSGTLSSEFISKLSGGAFFLVESISNATKHGDIDSALLVTADALQDVKNTVDAVPITTSLTVAQKASISAAKTSIATEIAAISAKIQAIAVGRATNAGNLSTAKNTLASAEDDLALKQAGSTPEQILVQEAKVKSAKARIGSINAKIGKTIVRAPIRGIVTVQDAKVGEIVTANVKVISLISEADFEIEANVPEADVAKIELGDDAKVTLDAYGNDEIFEANVVKIDPAETIIEGVATYKTTLQFVGGNGRIRSGMTANIDVFTNMADNVIAIPARSVITRNGDKIVRVLEGDEVREAEVEVGLRGSFGSIEIKSGINEGDQVILFIER